MKIKIVDNPTQIQLTGDKLKSYQIAFITTYHSGEAQKGDIVIKYDGLLFNLNRGIFCGPSNMIYVKPLAKDQTVVLSNETN